jgi:hypothetical protein
MGIVLIWEEDCGTELARLNDPQSLMQKWLPPESAFEFVYLRFIDPYGDTIFNMLQLPMLLQELKACSSNALEAKVADHLSKAIALVTGVQGFNHTYVRFIGDHNID